MKYVFSILLLVIMQACISCDPTGTAKCEKEYSFELSLSLSTDLDTFTLQDTIWIESAIDMKLLDLVSGDSIMVDSFDFMIYSKISKVIDTIGFAHGENSFMYLNKIGEFQVQNFSNGSKGRLVYAIKHGKQELRIGMIPKNTGLYDIVFYNLSDDLINLEFPEQCTVNIKNINYRMNMGNNNNFHLVMDAYKQFYPNSLYNEDGFNSSGGYAFVVIE